MKLYVSLLALFLITPLLVLAQCPPDCANTASITAESYANPDSYANPQFIQNSDPAKWDFSKVTWSSVPVEKWKEIPAARMNEVPADQLQPKNLLPEQVNALDANHIATKIADFPNLAQAEPTALKDALRQKTGADVSIEGVTELRYDLQSSVYDHPNVLVGPFPGFSPDQYPAAKYAITIKGDQIIITDKNSVSSSTIRGTAFVEPGAQTGGGLFVVADISKPLEVTGRSVELSTFDHKIYTIKTDEGGSISAKDGVITGKGAQIRYVDSGSRSITITGSFDIQGTSATLRPYDGEQSEYIAISQDAQGRSVDRVEVRTTGHDLLVLPGGATPPPNAVANIVTYGPDVLIVKGAADVQRGDLRVSSNDEASRFAAFQNGMIAEGRLRVEDAKIIYEGQQSESRLQRDSKPTGDTMTFDGSEGTIGTLTHKLRIGDTNKATISTEALQTTITKDSEGVASIPDAASTQRIAERLRNGDVLLDSGRYITLGDPALGDVMAIGDEGDISIQQNGKTVDILSPLRSQQIVGPDLIPVFDRIAALEKEAAQELYPGRQKGLSEENKKTLDSLQYLVIDARGKTDIENGHLDEAIQRKQVFLQGKENSPIASAINLDIAQLYVSSATTATGEDSKTAWLSVRDYADRAKGDAQLGLQATLLSAQAKAITGTGDATSDFNQVVTAASALPADSPERQQLLSQAYSGLAGTMLATAKDVSDSRKALALLTQAATIDPDNQGIKQQRLELQAGLIEGIRQTTFAQASQLDAAVQAKIPEGSLLRGVGTSVAGLLGYYDDIVTVGMDESDRLNSQARGMMLIPQLLRSGNDLQTILQASPSDIATLFDFQINHPDPAIAARQREKMELVWSDIHASAANPDVQHILEGKGAAFTFEGGQGYASKDVTDTIAITWKDTVFDAVNAKNVLLLAGPGATVGGARLVGWGAEVGGTSVVGIAGRGLGATTQYVLGAEKTAALVGKTGEIVTSATSFVVDSKAVAAIKSALPTEFLGTQVSTGYNIIDKSISATAGFTQKFVVETAYQFGAGEAAYLAVKPFSPEQADDIAMLVMGIAGERTSLLNQFTQRALATSTTVASDVVKVAVDAAGKPIAPIVEAQPGAAAKIAEELGATATVTEGGTLLEKGGERLFVPSGNVPAKIGDASVAAVTTVNPTATAQTVLADSERAAEALRSMERAATSTAPAEKVAAAIEAAPAQTFEEYVKDGIRQLTAGQVPPGWERIGGGPAGQIASRDGVVYKLPSLEGEADLVVKIMPDNFDGALKETMRLNKMSEFGASQRPVLLETNRIPGTADGFMVSELVNGVTVSKAVGKDFAGWNREVEVVLEGATYKINPRELVEKNWRKLAENGYEFGDKWNTDNMMIALENGEPVVKVIDAGGIRLKNIPLDNPAAIEEFYRLEYGVSAQNFEKIAIEQWERRLTALENRGPTKLDAYLPETPATKFDELATEIDTPITDRSFAPPEETLAEAFPPANIPVETPAGVPTGGPTITPAAPEMPRTPQGEWLVNPDTKKPWFSTIETREVPKGFETPETFEVYRETVSQRIENAVKNSLGIDTPVQAGIQGSAATGVSSKTGQFIEKPGDMDIVIVNNELFDTTMNRAADLARQGKLMKKGTPEQQLAYVQNFRERGIALIHDARLLPELQKSALQTPEMGKGIKISLMVSKTGTEIQQKYMIPIMK